MPILEEATKICDLFGMDPYCAISEGTLIVTCRKEKTSELLSRFEAKDIVAATIGETLPREEGVTLVEDGRERVLEHPRVDPFWAAFGRAMEEAATG